MVPSSRLLRRRVATAAGSYLSVVLGVVGTLVAARVLGPDRFGVLSLVLVAASFFLLLLDFTVEEALVKFGFRYTEAGEWGRLRRLFARVVGLKAAGAVLAGAGMLVLAPLAEHVFDRDLKAPLLVAALLPLATAPENLGGTALLLRGRYDVRAFFLVVTQALRLTGVVVAVDHGVTAVVIGLVAGQAAGSAAVALAGWSAFRRFPAAPQEAIGADRRSLLRFVVQSSVGTGLVSLRSVLGTLVLGAVANPTQVGYFRAAQAPQLAFAALSSPARMILLTEQTRDWERGERRAVFRSVGRYMAGSVAAMAVLLPPLLWFMPDLIRIAYKAKFLPASDAARLILGAAAIQLVFGWTKSFPISIGRPGLRTLGYALEAAVVIPLVAVLGAKWGATGAGGAILGATAVGSLFWVVLLVRLRREHVEPALGASTLQREAVQP